MFSAPFVSSLAALTEEVTAKDNVAPMSAAYIKPKNRAPNIALMRCDFVGYMAEALGFWHAKPGICS